MYAQEPLVLELTALLKAHGVRNIVISPGSRHYAFTRTFENDQDFSLHSVVDERSAAFYALGLIQATGEPAATICTSGTAALNYGSAMAEAAAQKLPLVAITTDRLPEFLGQMEDQMIDQRGLFDGFVRYAGDLRPIANERDRWYCNRVINEALVAAREGGGGPVHLNVPIESHSGVQFTVPHLPDVRVIARHRLELEEPDWTALAERLGRTARPPRLGAGRAPERARRRRARRLHRVVRRGGHRRPPRQPAPRRAHRQSPGLPPHRRGDSPELKPDVVITFGGNVVFKDELKGFLNGSDHEHWRVDPDGAIADPFRTLTDVFQCDPSTSSNAWSRHAPIHRPPGRTRVACSRPRTRSRRRRRNTANWRRSVLSCGHFPRAAHSTSPTALRSGWPSSTESINRSTSSATGE